MIAYLHCYLILFKWIHRMSNMLVSQGDDE
jgi:hypothetical protein